jgi:hypothetical protein
MNDLQDFCALTLLARLISGRVRDKIRKSKGKGYTPIVSHIATTFEHFGLFEIRLSVNPGSLENRRMRF